MEKDKCTKDPMTCEYSEFIEWPLKNLKYIICRIKNPKETRLRCRYPCKEWK
jgi:hypothetical protein